MNDKIKELSRRVDLIEFNNTYAFRSTRSKAKVSSLVITAVVGIVAFLLLIFHTDKIIDVVYQGAAIASPTFMLNRDTLTLEVKQAKSASSMKSGVTTISGPYTGKYKDTNAGKAYNYLTSKGVSPVATCAILGNLCEETNGASTQFDKHDLKPESTYDGYHGLAMWEGGRWDNCKRYCAANNLDYLSAEGQIQFLYEEATNTRWGASFRIKGLKNPMSFGGQAAECYLNLPDNFWETDDVKKATKAWALCFEGCIYNKNVECFEGIQKLKQRQAAAVECYEKFVEGKE